MMLAPVPGKSAKYKPSMAPGNDVGRNRHALEQRLDASGVQGQSSRAHSPKDGKAVLKGASWRRALGTVQLSSSWLPRGKLFITNRVLLQLAKFLHHRLRELFCVHQF